MAAKKKKRKTPRKWSHQVTTESTFPSPGTFTGDAESIARIMASKRVSPKGIGFGIRMVQFFINRAGKNLPESRRRELEKAKKLLQDRSKRQRNAPESRTRSTKRRSRSRTSSHGSR